jgi:hypothetical protein
VRLTSHARFGEEDGEDRSGYPLYGVPVLTLHRLHWVLDLAFREDDSCVRSGHAAANFAVLRHIALNLLRQERSVTAGIKAKRLKAGWDEAYLLKILAGA